MRPNSVAVGASRLTDGELDLGPEADDSLSAAMLQTLVAGGNADALHGHAAQGAGGGGGSCYTALGTGECGAGYGAMYSGILVNASQGTWGSVGPVCIRSEALTFNAESQYWQYFYAIGAGRRFRAEGNAISCAMCCPGAGAADEN